MLDSKGNWIQYLPLVEFAYSISFQATIGMAPYEALNCRKCRLPLYWDEVGKRQLNWPENDPRHKREGCTHSEADVRRPKPTKDLCG
jgi:hypothetical protein